VKRAVATFEDVPPLAVALESRIIFLHSLVAHVDTCRPIFWYFSLPLTLVVRVSVASEIECDVTSFNDLLFVSRRPRHQSPFEHLLSSLSHVLQIPVRVIDIDGDEATVLTLLSSGFSVRSFRLPLDARLLCSCTMSLRPALSLLLESHTFSLQQSFFPLYSSGLAFFLLSLSALLGRVVLVPTVIGAASPCWSQPVADDMLVSAMGVTVS